MHIYIYIDIYIYMQRQKSFTTLYESKIFGKGKGLIEKQVDFGKFDYGSRHSETDWIVKEKPDTIETQNIECLPNE